MSDTILGRIDEMGKRVEELERSITELMDTTGGSGGGGAAAAAAGSAEGATATAAQRR